MLEEFSLIVFYQYLQICTDNVIKNETLEIAYVEQNICTTVNTHFYITVAETSAKVVEQDFDHFDEITQPSKLRQKTAIILADTDKKYAGKKTSRKNFNADLSDGKKPFHTLFTSSMSLPN